MITWQQNVANSVPVDQLTAAPQISGGGPMRFNVQGPTSLAAINQYIGNYSNPDAAEADTRANAPQGYDYLVNQYQKLTGNSSANPFDDARNKLAQNRLMNIASGLNDNGANGGIIGITDAARTAKILANNPTSSLWDQNTFFANHPLQGAQGFTGTINGQQISSAAPSVATLQMERAGQVQGGGDLFKQIRQDHVLPTNVSGNNGLPLSRGQTSSNLDVSLLQNPHFATLQKQDPDRAAQFYEAITGRPLDQDIAGHQAQVKAQQDYEDKMSTDLANSQIGVDPITGGLVRNKFVKAGGGGELSAALGENDSNTDVQKIAIPLSQSENEYINSGKFKMRNGYDAVAPEIMQARQTIDTIPQQLRQPFAALYQKYISAGLPAHFAAIKAKQDLPDPNSSTAQPSAAQPSAAASPSILASNPGDSGYPVIGDTVASTGATLTNSLTQGANAFLGSHIPTNPYGMFQNNGGNQAVNPTVLQDMRSISAKNMEQGGGPFDNPSVLDNLWNLLSPEQ